VRVTDEEDSMDEEDSTEEGCVSLSFKEQTKPPPWVNSQCPAWILRREKFSLSCLAAQFA